MQENKKKIFKNKQVFIAIIFFKCSNCFLLFSGTALHQLPLFVHTHTAFDCLQKLQIIVM